jgi:crotonobetainyl-CoA:carnitine CoA-transferase CaiB-like acyl-CoA transferase
VWNVMNRGKRSLALEAKTPEGRVILERVVGGADIVLHNYSPRGAASLGIDANAVAKLNPDAITIAMTGYGETGPMALFFSFGPLLEAYCGLNSVTGYAGEDPLRLGKAFPDVVGGLHGTFTTLCALWERAATGAPVHADLSQLETLASVVGDGLLWTSVTGEVPARRGNRSLDHAPQGVYRCAGDDAWVAVTVTDDAGWRALAAIVGADALGELTLAERFARHDELDVAIERWSAGLDALAAATRLQAVGIPACPAFSNGDLVDSEHLAARGFMVTWDQPDAGPLRFPGFPIHFERRRYEPVAAPALGADNAAILRRLGYDDARIDELAAAGVIAEKPPW